MIAIGQIPAQQPDRIVYSKNGGTQIVQEWKGPAGLMSGLVAQLRVAYDEVETSEQDGVVTVRGMNRAPIGYETEAGVVNYDLVSESQTVDMAHAAYFAGLSDELIVSVNSAFALSGKTLAQKSAVLSAAAGGLIIENAAIVLAKELLMMKERGQDSFVDTSWSLTRTLSVSRYYPHRISLTGHGLLWTNGQINTYCGSLPLITLPTQTATPQQSAIGLVQLWHKYQSQVQFSSAGSFNLVEGWRLALWNTKIYTSY